MIFWGVRFGGLRKETRIFGGLKCYIWTKIVNLVDFLILVPLVYGAFRGFHQGLLMEMSTFFGLLGSLGRRISAHMAGIGGLIGLLCKINSCGDGIFDLMPVICTMIIVAGILGTSRIAMERHTLWQVLTGALNGFLCVFLI